MDKNESNTPENEEQAPLLIIEGDPAEVLGTIMRLMFLREMAHQIEEQKKRDGDETTVTE